MRSMRPKTACVPSRACARSRAHGGVGLGLSLVWEIAALHGGTVQIERSGADGTVMLVTLPRDGKEA